MIGGLARAGSILPLLRARFVRTGVADQVRFYDGMDDEDRASRWQLERLNEVWTAARHRVPYFQRVARERTLPDSFTTLEEFFGSVPTMDRHTVQLAGDALRDPAVAPSGIRTTGGSTGEPIRVEVARAEARMAAADVWYGRSWLGVDPADRLFLFWGHSHALGRGARARVAAAWRRGKDIALGYARQSCYDLSDQGLLAAADRLLSFRPQWVLGYTVALDRLAGFASDLGDAFRSLRLKVVVCTAEAFPRGDSRERLSRFFGCPVVMEYGSVEAGPLAHECSADRYRVFWRHHLLEGIESSEVPGAQEVLVTSLYPRRTPLMRYRIGDLVVPSEDAGHVRRGFRKVLGRCNDVVVLPDDTRVHSEAFTHALKEIEGISRFEVVQRSGGQVVLRYMAPEVLGADALARVRRRLGRAHPALEGIAVDRVVSLPMTVAGKSRPIRRE